MVYAVFYTFSYVNNLYKWQESDCITVSRMWHRLYFQLLSSHVRFRRGFLNLEVTPRPARRDTTDRGCFCRNHSQTSLIFHLSLPFFFVSRSPVLLPCQTPWHQRRYGNDGGMINLHLCLIINSMVIKYSHSHSCRVTKHQVLCSWVDDGWRWNKLKTSLWKPQSSSLTRT